MTLTQRRLRNVAILFAIGVVIVFLHAVTTIGLEEPAIFSGWLLLLTVLLLVLLNSRKKMSFLPLSSAYAWLQFHIYAGWLSIGLFILHVGPTIPNGALEISLAVFFVIVAVSGVAGAFFSVSIPKRMTRRGEEVIYERIPQFRMQIRKRAKDLVFLAAQEAESTTIPEFYARRLEPLFQGPRNFLEHLFETNVSQFALYTEIQSIGRYLNDTEREIMAEMSELVQRKHDLDYHYALQTTLKGWLFVHIPMTYGMLILAFVHLVLAYAFTGGVGG